MPIFPPDDRLAELRRLGLCEPLLRLAAGELIHPLFDPRYVGPPAYVYSENDPDDEDLDAWFPDGPMLVPFWSFADSVTGVWEVDGALQFVDFDIEAPDAVEVVATTEQGFLAWMFQELHEDLFDEEDDFARLPDAAEVIGFRHYDDWLAYYEAEDISSVEDWDRFQAEFIKRIDALKTSRDRVRP